jgi:hypothetical protein
VIAIAKLTNDPNYKAYRQGRKIRPVVDNLLATTGIDLTNGGGIPELIKFQEHFKEYRIGVFAGLNCKDLVFDGQVQSEKRINLLYDDVTHHYKVINSVRGVLSGQFVKFVIEGAKEMKCIRVRRRLVTVCQFHQVHPRLFESPSSHVIV